MRWYGPQDGVTLTSIRQAGVSGIVNALHEFAPGEIWPVAAIRERQTLIRAAGMEWEVVESLPVSEAIKQQKGDYLQHIENYKESLKNLAQCGIRVITYNFMPVLDWVRTAVDYTNPDGSRTLRFDLTAFAYFDLYLLKRPSAESDYSEVVRAAAKELSQSISDEQRERLRRSVLQGLPGSDDSFTEAQLLKLLEQYNRIPESRLREHLVYFLKEVVPVAAAHGMVLAVHPDDPPFPLLGLPRVVSSQSDLQALFEAVPEAANGICYCTGSLGAGINNDLHGILDAFSERIHFLHLRNVIHEQPGVFRESEHLSGQASMEVIVDRLLGIMQSRKLRIPMRPDHGVLMELESGLRSYPGYSLIGRLKGLAELRGLEQGLLYRAKTNSGID